jgi:asparagine synthase (glutamine-hydrolysing)
MCGIAGILLPPRAADPDRLGAAAAMSRRMLHRGPDSGGVWADPQAGLALAHRRLAIVDLSPAGNQPIVSANGRLVMTFNGEVYNFRDLRGDLESRGITFRSQSDSEVMLEAFDRLGLDPALDRFAGMFALGLWDRASRTLHLIRDRVGKKPLHVALVDGALVFASELKAFHALPGFRPSIDPRAVAMVLRQGWIPDELCIWRDVIKLPPGSILSVRAEDLETADIASLRARARRWWSLDEVAARGQYAPRAAETPALEEDLDALLRTVVGERMLADVPLGAFLSGGIDSATVVALMQAQSVRPVRTFTIGFDEAGFDEAAQAESVARHLGTDHTTFRVTPAEARAVIPDLPRIWDEPFADESQIPTYLVSRLARRHVTVALSGDGGDESFGGYARHAAATLLQPALRLPRWLRYAGATALRGAGPDRLAGLAHRLAPSAVPPGAPRLRKLTGALAARDEDDLYQQFLGLAADPLAGEPRDYARPQPPPLPDLASRLMYRDTIDYLPGDILVKLDRASMAVSLEARCPLLDHRLIGFAWRLPTEVKLRDGKGKWLLRQVLRRYVPDALFERPKHGFDLPIGSWLVGPLRDWAEEMLGPRRLQDQGLLDPVRIGACWRDHLSGRVDGAHALWAALMVSAWLAEKPAAPEPPTAAGPSAATGEVVASAMPSGAC